MSIKKREELAGSIGDRSPKDGFFIGALTLRMPRPDSLVLSGSLQSSGDEGELAAQFERIHREIVEGGLAELTVDLRKLGSVSSSGIRLFVIWISRAEAAGYRLIFLVDNRVTWHRLSFSVLPALAPNTVRVVNDGGTAKGATS
jgi:hypothetical protein